jgi:preprotein translocase subunit YajC
MELIPLIIIFGAMWLLFIRPQQKRVRAHRDLIGSVQVGDEIITAGGLIATVTGIDDDRLRVQVAPGNEVHIVRGAVSRKIGPEIPDTFDGSTGEPT